MARLRTNFQSGTISDNPAAVGALVLNSAAFANLPVVASPDILAVTLDPQRVAGAAEIVWVTAHAAAATSVTVLRGQEGSAARAHNQGERWVAGPTVGDFWGGGQAWFGDQTVEGKLNLRAAGGTSPVIVLDPSASRMATYGDQNGIAGFDAAGNPRYLVGLRSDVTGNATDLTLYSYGGKLWVTGFPAFIVNGGDVRSQGVGGVPRFYLKATDSATDAKVWDIVPSGSSLLFRMINDAENAANSWLTVTRGGYAPRVATFATDVVVLGSTGAVGNSIGIMGPRNRLVQTQRGGAFSTSSTVYADYGFPGVSFPKQIAASLLHVRISGSAWADAAGRILTFGISDGVTNYDIGNFAFGISGAHQTFAFVGVLGGIAAGSKTWTLRWHVNGGTVTMDTWDQIAVEIEEITSLS